MFQTVKCEPFLSISVYGLLICYSFTVPGFCPLTGFRCNRNFLADALGREVEFVILSEQIPLARASSAIDALRDAQKMCAVTKVGTVLKHGLKLFSSWKLLTDVYRLQI